jgi:predicted amidohydrolase
VVQPIIHAPPDDERNVVESVAYVEAAVAQGAQLVVFPESYPGPWRTPPTYDPTPVLVEAARRCGVYVAFGTLETIDSDKASAYNVLMLADPSGGAPGVYRRTHPPGPWLYRGGDYWDFDYVPGNAFPVFDTPLARIGMAICSEVYMPEVSRALALRGAECILIPGGGALRRLWATWRNLIWSRAIENLAVVVTTQNLFDLSEPGLAMVASPEEVVFECTGPGLFVVQVHLDRLREMRAENDSWEVTTKYGAKPGVLSHWQRPDMYGQVFPEETTPRLR